MSEKLGPFNQDRQPRFKKPNEEVGIWAEDDTTKDTEDKSATPKKQGWLDKKFPYDPERRKAIKTGAVIAGAVVVGGAALAAERAGYIKVSDREDPRDQTPEEQQEEVVEAMDKRDLKEKVQKGEDGSQVSESQEVTTDPNFEYSDE